MRSFSSIACALPLLASVATAAPAVFKGFEKRDPAAVPDGGVDARPNASAPIYHTDSDFDFQSLNLALNQEWIELDLFRYGVERFSEEEFAAAGIDAEDISLINFMADQEVGHATLLTNILSSHGRTPAKQCTYQYDFETVRDFVNFCQRLTRWGESGVYGFLPHLDSRPSAQLLLQSITTEARQQMIFRQFSGAHPMPVYFETGISQSMAWSLLQPYLATCPAENPRIEWQIYPNLNVVNETSLLVDGYNAAITHNRTSLTSPGQQVHFTWDAPGQNTSWNSSYTTSIGGNVTDTTPKYVAWVSQLNTTYTEFNSTGNYSGYTYQPDGVVFDNTSDGVVNGTMFVGLTDSNPYVTPYNLSLLNDVLIAWGEYQAN
ncbi:hypothetical protein L202_03101 [Cryptococcus amylolentus CBS 6039]|uniref:Rds1 protein n=2 Tax=Cryptococcus amylolentus TaxID=104669 RepID=A0A1E3HXE4_9TREE|nr:hypothetical protein L202_03101 [Cryptococcus amylolentus CBS 6039]ODN80992.1 hypothetical protein L202_03101 [Cryptococcus amylolentus CBS 6039]ODO09470.1 hypothetical protein I350_03070 [Cryptococcus amylolentus CBS 6273]